MKDFFLRKMQPDSNIACFRVVNLALLFPGIFSVLKNISLKGNLSLSSVHSMRMKVSHGVSLLVASQSIEENDTCVGILGLLASASLSLVSEEDRSTQTTKLLPFLSFFTQLWRKCQIKLFWGKEIMRQ